MPIIFDMSMNTLQIGGDRSPNNSHAHVMNTISNLLKRFSDYNGKCIVDYFDDDP